MALTNYQTQTRRLLQNPSAPQQLYDDSTVNGNINLARGQIAGESQCLRVFASLALTAGTNSYAFSAINTGVSATTGIAGVLNVRQVSVVVGTGYMKVDTREWQWFQQYKLNEVVPSTGQPTVYAQLAQGVTGSLYFWPLPDIAYTCNMDVLCYPIDLVNDATVEAIPYPWTLSVPYLAAYYCYMDAQRQDDADRMYKRYTEFREMGRRISTSMTLPTVNPQVPDPTQPNKLGMTQGAGQ